MQLKARTPNGLYYATKKDLVPVCTKCKQAYYRDYIELDCHYCPIPQMIELLKNYAERLDRQ